MAPQTDNGKLFCCFYGLIAICVLGYTLTLVSEIFNAFVRRVNTKIDIPFMNEANENMVFLVFFVVLYVLFAALVVYLGYGQAGWSWLDCFYWAFTTFTTVGFGDYYIEGVGAFDSAVLARWLSI